MENIENILNSVKTENPLEYTALSLAYIGDCIYELYVRCHITRGGNHKVKDLHKTSIKYVCAKAQAEFYHKIEGILTEEEMSAFKRGRNTKSHPPKNADMSDYKIATGVEAMLGYLYLAGKTERISYLMEKLF